MNLLRHVAFLVLWAPLAFGQTPHAQEPVAGTYQRLGALSAARSPQRAGLDTLSFPTKEYGSSLTYVLVKPYYLSAPQVDALTASVAPPANSSDQTRQELDYLLGLQQARTPAQVQRVELLGNIGLG